MTENTTEEIRQADDTLAPYYRIHEILVHAILVLTDQAVELDATLARQATSTTGPTVEIH